ncbi:class I SAM-dependent methyltransferase [Nocardioides jejuensis]|uniref:SAM-dependent methyltransferase n=1 Tax=Nocardioides jejuensis TaxID=2502782 RepID=A0A4R1CHX2_9ACTN|nr:SAM-dependent methyltransferase [Nocardioides jejuensis]TCJ30357.1 SAM-dependent methyltransferase [Nocardioides jejuensis]
MSEPLLRAQMRVRTLLLDGEQMVRAVASGRQRGTEPAWRRAELRYVDLKAGRHLQITTYDATQAHTANHAVGDAARDAVDALLEVPFGNWHVETLTEQHQMRVTKKHEALIHTTARATPVDAAQVVRGHDKPKERLLAEDHPVLVELGISDSQGRIKPSRQAKYRQVEEFVRLLDASVTDAIKSGSLRRPTKDDPLRIVDLGCGNAYLTFAAQAHLGATLPVHLTGVDVKQQSRDHNSAVAERLGLDMDFVVGTIAAAELPQAPDVVLALHACDTATDEALARASEWQAALVLAAPCCHHDIAAQLRKARTPSPYAMLTRHGILRERFADTLTDAVRAAILRLLGYRVDVVEFVESEHTPRNTLLRAVRTGGVVKGGSVRKEYDELVDTWAIRPHLAVLTGIASTEGVTLDA